MRIAYSAADENGTTRAVVRYLAEQGHEVVIPTDSDRWPEIGAAVGAAVAGGEVDYGVVKCWTGTGTAIAANKVPGVRAALAWDPWIAQGVRLWNDANVLALSLKRLAGRGRGGGTGVSRHVHAGPGRGREHRPARRG